MVYVFPVIPMYSPSYFLYGIKEFFSLVDTKIRSELESK